MRTIVTAMSVVLITCVCQEALGATWYVDGSVAESGDGTTWGTAFQKIQEGIDAASHGDTVIVAEGIYEQNIEFKGKNIVLRSSDPTNPTVVENTVIDGNQAGPVITFAGTEDETCVLAGFTVRNGNGESGGGVQGGTHGKRPRATIRNNVITENQSGYYGGGGLSHCDGMIENNTITDNSATFGGGLSGCRGMIENNTISRNSASARGGGLYSCLTVQNNTVSDNSADEDGGGLCECHWIEKNTITGNSAGKRGGGLAQCWGPIYGNTIAGNSAQEGGGVYDSGAPFLNNKVSGNSASEDGGGLAGCHGTLQNNLIASNSAQRGGGLAYCDGTIQNNTIVNNSAAGAKSVGGGLAFCYGAIRNCVVWENTAEGSGNQTYKSDGVSFSCIQDWAGGGPGNISDNPLFADTSVDDYHLQEGSLCIDAGANYYWFVWPQRDLDNNCRLGGKGVDMGCYERGASPDSDGDLLCDSDEEGLRTDPLSDDTDRDGLRDGLELLRGSNPRQSTPAVVTYVTSDGPTIQEALCLAVPGDEIVVTPGTYHENLQFARTEVILRSSDPQNPDVVSSTIIDGRALGPVVSFTGAESEACLLAGFTIQNGRAGSGAGVCGGTPGVMYIYTHATIRNNTISGNSAEYLGGGGVAYCAGTIENNTITENSAIGGGSCGGALYSCYGVIQDNTITRNSAQYAGGGAAYCDGTIRNNVIAVNSAEHGGGLHECNGTIQNNVISGNLAEVSGGGLHQCVGAMRDNTITRNSAEKGGGLSWCSGTIRNCIIWANTAMTGPQLAYSGQPMYSCIQNWAAGARGNIGDDPQFLDPDGPDDNPETYGDNDYHLAEASPCIDAGGNEEWMWDAADMDGNPRIFPVKSRFSWKVDMGAYEYIPDDYPFTACIRANGDGIQVIWTSHAGDTFTVRSRVDLLTGEWIEEASVPSRGLTTSWTHTDMASMCKFYRIEVK